MRSVVFRYGSAADLSVALEEARRAPGRPPSDTERSRRAGDSAAPPASLRGAEGALPVPEGENVAEGEWVLATFEIGSRRQATASAARAVAIAGELCLEFERRDWERLHSFVAARSEHMKAARPLTPSVARIPIAVEAPPATEPPPPRSRRFDDLPPSSVLESTRVPFGARVLVVDDDAENAEEVRAMLTASGLVVELVGTALDADARLAAQSFDALVLDLHAPGGGTRDLVTRLRAEGRAADLPVLFLASRPSSRDAVDAFASGGDDFLARPFRATELAARIFGLLRRARLLAANR